ncbi:NAD(P)-dependent oxidoreductase [Streptomyces sp. NPDC088124]|uniref:NAD(P)-dependent oxidoreductase n=1 Tax=Streptomyces sp. NPDC088124 TaxID=3154654 RepID=UPI003426E545
MDEEALTDPLHSGHLGGAGIDVFSSEPPVGNRLLDAPGVVLPPHCAAFSDQANQAMGTTVAADVVRVLRGEEPANAVIRPASDPPLAHLRPTGPPTAQEPVRHRRDASDLQKQTLFGRSAVERADKVS